MAQGEQLDLLCGRFFIAPPHDRLIRTYMPTNLVTRAMDDRGEEEIGSASNQLASLVGLMRMESAGDRAGGRAILNALSSALFTLVMRAASESEKAPDGLLALAGHPRLAPGAAAEIEKIKPALQGKTIGVQTASTAAAFVDKYLKGVVDVREYKTTEEHDLDLKAGPWIW